MAHKRKKRVAAQKRPSRGASRARDGAPRAAGDPAPEPRRASVPTPEPAPSPLPGPEEATDPQAVDDPLPVVGIGASAGGLEALEVFLKGVPERSGVAWVLVQHLDPADKGTMVSLLQRSTAMKVVQVADRQKIKADHVYVIPPNRDMSILHGVLHLMPHVAPRGLNLPVDYFFRSLAADRNERGIAVVLSGMGSDGTLGVRAIKERGGAAFVQSLDSAKFDGMPRSAIDTGLADVIASAEELPSRILSYLQHAVSRPRAGTQEEKAQSALEKIFILLRNQTGNDFSLYKRSTVLRRIERRMGLHQIDKIANYVRFLRENPKEVELLFKELLIGVTSFFRDSAAWEHLERELLPDLIDARAASGPGATLRAWVPGCSTGEEAYSLAIVVKEAIAAKKLSANLSVQIFATDLDAEAIERARIGAYPANIAADVSPERLRKFFIQDDRGYRVSKEVRESVIFAPQNIATDPPFTKLDLLACRNLLIYLSPELQKRLIPLFHYSLLPRGLLFLGSAETVGTFAHLFQPVDGRTRLYRKLEGALSPAVVEFPAAFAAPAAPTGSLAHDAPEPGRPLPNLQVLAERVIVQRYAPTAVLTTQKGDVLYTSGRTGKYLEPAVGRANLNVFAMAREGLRYELSAAFSAALREDGPVTARGIRVGTNGGTQNVDVTVQRLTEPKELRGTVMIVISDVLLPPPGPAPRRAGATGPRLIELERDLQQAREEVQTTREEMQTSQEELKSMNEELQSTNEELQSTNEELTTSKEEMQSMNEELQTVNHELQAKVDELSRSNNDMKNLLNSTDIATLFLDGELLVRRFTTQTSKLIKLIPGDTGRLITDIASDLDYPELTEDAREVLRTLVFKEKQVPARNGRWFTVRILPYRTLENVIDGVVITFSDVTATKVLEERLRQQAAELREMTDALPTLVWASRADGACEYLSRRWLDYTGVPESEQLGYRWLDQVHADDRERLREAWRAAVRDESPLEIDVRIGGKDGAYRWFKTRAVPIRDEQGALSRWYGTHTDVDDLKRAAGAAG